MANFCRTGRIVNICSIRRIPAFSAQGALLQMHRFLPDLPSIMKSQCRDMDFRSKVQADLLINLKNSKNPNKTTPSSPSMAALEHSREPGDSTVTATECSMLKPPSALGPLLCCSANAAALLLYRPAALWLDTELTTVSQPWGR